MREDFRAVLTEQRAQLAHRYFEGKRHRKNPSYRGAGHQIEAPRQRFSHVVLHGRQHLSRVQAKVASS